MEKVSTSNQKAIDRDMRDEGAAPGIVQSRRAFLRDLPALLHDSKHDRWSVAYRGDERIALAACEKDVIQECLKRGLKADEYYIGTVAPYDHDGEIEPSLFEFDPED